MNRPSRENLTSLTDAMISEKNDLEPGASGASNIFAWFAHSAFWRMSASRMEPFELLYANRSHRDG